MRCIVPMDPLKVRMFIWSIPHYRVPVYRRLSQNPNLDFVICAGDNTATIDGASVPSAAEVGVAKEVKWHRLESRRLRWFRHYEWQPEVVKMAWRGDFDVVISQGNKSLSNWVLWVLCRLRRVPIIDWSIGVMGAEKGLKWMIRKFLLSWPNVHLLYGRLARDFYVQHGFEADRVFVVHNSLDHERQVVIRKTLTVEQISAVRERFGTAGGDDRLLFHSGRIEKKKNLSLLLRAIKRLQMRGRRIVLVIIGSGREEDSLRKQVQEDDLASQVVFFGPCYDEPVLGRIIAASDLSVVPGVTGLIAMHSMVYGTPILTRDNSAGLHGPEVEAVIEGQTGGYFRDGDLDDLVHKMEAMLYPTPCKERMREACMKIIDEEYTPQYQERVIIQALNRVLPKELQVPVPP